MVDCVLSITGTGMLPVFCCREWLDCQDSTRVVAPSKKKKKRVARLGINNSTSCSRCFLLKCSYDMT